MLQQWDNMPQNAGGSERMIMLSFEIRMFANVKSISSSFLPQKTCVRSGRAAALHMGAGGSFQMMKHPSALNYPEFCGILVVSLGTQV